MGVEGFEKSLTGIDNKLFESGFIVTVKFRYNQFSVDCFHLGIDKYRHPFRYAQPCW
ncbi:hypothetical protein STCA_0788 [Klebsiella pneumoniae]|nr:hypothetical protein H219_2751 [Klebsiella pneumoniae DMC1316]SJM98792.1 hypothetical protein STCA_0788 [Klebsiella pneumoniae]